MRSEIVKYNTEYCQVLKGEKEQNNWHDWVTYILTAPILTVPLTTKQIRAMLLLKDEFEKQMKQTLGAWYSYQLLPLMFTLPYLKIELLEKKSISSPAKSIYLVKEIG